MNQELDPRLVQVSIEVNGELKSYTGLKIEATGTKYANANQNEMELKITNVDNATLNYILTATSPYNANKTPKLIILQAGRVSYGLSTVFQGTIISAKPSQPPDITLTIKALTGNYANGNIIALTQPAQQQLSKISQQVASTLGLNLIFQAQDRNIANFSFTGGSLKLVDKLGNIGSVNAYVDDNNLIVKNYNVPLQNRTKIVSEETGMIGIPEITEQGVKVKFLFDNKTVLGGALQLISKVYPAVNGNYVIYKLDFEIANREIPFYWTAEVKQQNQSFTAVKKIKVKKIK